jgi:hypothetical protein
VSCEYARDLISCGGDFAQSTLFSRTANREPRTANREPRTVIGNRNASSGLYSRVAAGVGVAHLGERQQ